MKKLGYGFFYHLAERDMSRAKEALKKFESKQVRTEVNTQTTQKGYSIERY